MSAGAVPGSGIQMALMLVMVSTKEPLDRIAAMFLDLCCCAVEDL